MADFISGLLGMGDDQDPMARAKQAGLLGLGATLLQGGAPSLTPTSLGSTLGQGVMAGQQASQQALQQARQQAIQQEMMGTMGGGQGGDVAAEVAKLQKMALLDPKNATTYLKLAEQKQGKTAAFTGEAANQALNLFGTADVSKLTPDQRAQAIAAADRSRANAAPRMTVNTSDPTAVAREMRGIVNDFDQKTEKPREIISQYQRMVNAVENPSAAGDIALVFSFYKTIDPISAVREGEYDKVLASSSVPDRIKNYIRKVQTGEVLAQGMREDLLNTARQNVNAVIPQLQNLTTNYRSFVSSIGGNPDQVIRDPLSGLNLGGSAPPARATSTPPAAPPSGAPRTNPPRRWNPQTGAFE